VTRRTPPFCIQFWPRGNRASSLRWQGPGQAPRRGVEGTIPSEGPRRRRGDRIRTGHHPVQIGAQAQTPTWRFLTLLSLMRTSAGKDVVGRRHNRPYPRRSVGRRRWMGPGPMRGAKSGSVAIPSSHLPGVKLPDGLRSRSGHQPASGQDRMTTVQGRGLGLTAVQTQEVPFGQAGRPRVRGPGGGDFGKRSIYTNNLVKSLE